MRRNNALSAFLLFLLLASTHLGNSQESVSQQKLILPDLSGCDIRQAMEEAPLTNDHCPSRRQPAGQPGPFSGYGGQPNPQ